MAELFDPGLQLERTHLAWSRTAAGFILNAGLVARLSRLVHPPALAWALAAVLAATGAWAWLYGRTSYASRVARLNRGSLRAEPRVLRTLARATTGAALVAALVALSVVAYG
jgi:uncharacterized membrane protein YidH (DUF202 family)